MKRFIFAFVLLLAFPLIVNAECDYTEFVRLKQIASNVNTSYEYITNEAGSSFAITLSNLTSEIYVHDDYFVNNYYYDGNSDLVLNNYSAGSTVKYDIYTTNSKCKNPFLFSIYVNLPTRNAFYGDPLCDGISNYKYCQKWFKTDISYDQFQKIITEYKNSLLNGNEKEEKEEILAPSFGEIIIDFISKYYLYIFSAVVVIGIVTISILKKKNSFDL